MLWVRKTLPRPKSILDRDRPVLLSRSSSQDECQHWESGPATELVTSAMLGALRDDAVTRAEFLRLSGAER